MKPILLAVAVALMVAAFATPSFAAFVSYMTIVVFYDYPSSSVILQTNAGTSTNVGPKYPSSGTNQIVGGGTTPWTNPGNITLDDGSNATASTGPTTDSDTDYLRGTTYGFSIPTGATINGILVEPDSSINSGTATWQARLVKADTAVGSIKLGATNGITTTPGYTSIPTSGASTDLWGTTWTPAEINATGFGVQITTSADTKVISVDTIRITIYYTTPGVGSQITVRSGTITIP